MAIRKKEYHFKNSIEVEEYVDGRFGAKGNKRTEKKKGDSGAGKKTEPVE